MEVNERLEQENPAGIMPEPVAAPLAAVPLAADSAAEEGADAEPAIPAWLRLAYCFEFLIAVIAILMLWSQIGGQGHLDLLPWYTKLACVLSLAWFCVRFTAGMVEQPKAWNRHSLLWFTGILLMCAIMGGIVYYYHLHEVPEDTDSEDSTAILLTLPSSHDQAHC